MQDIITELINGLITINLLFLIAMFLFHFHAEFTRRELTWYFALVGLPSVAIVAAMFVEKAGMLTMIWAQYIGSPPFTGLEIAVLIIGSMFTLLGLQWTIAILSRQRFGNGPWLIAVGVSLCYVVLSLLLRSY